MKKVFLTALLTAGLALASCGSNKTEADSTTATDSISSETTVPATTDTIATSTDTVTVPATSDTVKPAP